MRTSREPHALVLELKRAVAAIDPNIPVAKISTLEQLVAGSLVARRYQLLLLGLFALLALVLASVGIFGVLSYAANQRTREIGIRLALGAQPRDIFRMLLGHGLGLTLLGVAVGLVGAVALTHLLASLLFEITPTDPVTFAAVSLLLTVVALLACYIPARRATRVDPMTALRYE